MDSLAPIPFTCRAISGSATRFSTHIQWTSQKYTDLTTCITQRESLSVSYTHLDVYKRQLLYVFVFLMFFVCFAYAICWQKIIKRFDLNIGYANRSVYLLWSQIWAVFLFGEHLTMRNVLGIAIVLTGVVIVSLSAEQKEKGE